MAYVPPALRKREQGSATDGTLGTTAEAAGSHENLPPDMAPPKSIAGPTWADIHHHYWPLQDGEGGPSFGSFSTLNSSAQELDKLKYIMLFRDANPRWHSHGIIFVKSKLHLLPGGEKFSDDLPPETSQTSTEQPGETGYERRDSTQEKETCTEKAVVATNEASSQNSAVRGSQVDDDLHGNGQEAEPSEEIEKNRRKSTAPDHSDGTSISNHAHDSRTKDDKHHDPDPEPPYSPDLSLYNSGAIAVFEQVRGAQSQNAEFRFAGYYKIASLEYLAPHSRELFQLLEQKFTTTDRLGRARQRQRSAESWKRSLRHRWAVMQMEKDQDADASLSPPEIEVRSKSAEDADTSPKKSVNELLSEMRLKD